MDPRSHPPGLQQTEERAIERFSGPTRHARLRPEERERQIVDGAVEYFSAVGFGGDTRELAKRLGVTQPLLYRYFATKDALIERVFEEVFMGRWDPAWERIVADRTITLRERLLSFYKDYARTLLERGWIRIFMYAGLKGATINERFLTIIRERIILTLAAEVRHEYGLPSPDEVCLDELEIELLIGINSRIIYMAIRKWIYGMDVTTASVTSILEATIDVFLAGVPSVLREFVKPTGADA